MSASPQTSFKVSQTPNGPGISVLGGLNPLIVAQQLGHDLFKRD